MNQLQYFGQHKTTLVVTRHVSWAQNITEIAWRLGLCSGLCWEGLLGRRKREGRRKQLKWRNDEKGLQCPEFLTWKVGNCSYDANMPDQYRHCPFITFMNFLNMVKHVIGI